MSLELKTADLWPLWIQGNPSPPSPPNTHTHTHTYDTPKLPRQIAVGCPLGGTQGFYCEFLRSLQFYNVQIFLRLPMILSLCVHLICGPLLCFSLLLTPFLCHFIQHGSFPPSLSLFLSLFFTRFLSISMNIASTARCRKYIIWGLQLWYKKVQARTSGGCEQTEARCALMCVSPYATVICACACLQSVCLCTWASRSILCAYACVKVTAGQYIVPQMFDILCIRGWLEWEDKQVSDRSISSPQSATSAM